MIKPKAINREKVGRFWFAHYSIAVDVPASLRQGIPHSDYFLNISDGRFQKPARQI